MFKPVWPSDTRPVATPAPRTDFSNVARAWAMPMLVASGGAKNETSPAPNTQHVVFARPLHS